jgi:hypothetical protein
MSLRSQFVTAIPLSLDEARRSRSQSVTLNSDPKKLTQAVSESGQFAEGAKREKAIKANLKGLGYGG